MTPAERLSVLLMPPGLTLPVNHDAAISMLAHRLREQETTARAAVASLEHRITRTHAGDHTVWSLAPLVGGGAPLAVVVLPEEELLDAEAQAEHAAALDELPGEGAEALASVGEWASGGGVPSPELLARVMRGLTR